MNWIAVQSDILIAFKDSDKNSNNNMIWKLLREKHKNNTLCICIDADNPNQITFIERYSNSPFSSERLKTYIDCLYLTPIQTEALSKEPFFLSGLWEKTYNQFMNKYKAHATQIPYIEDVVLHENYMEDKEDAKRKANHKYLVEQFNYHDGKALEISKRYRESIYFRSILPFLSTVFLAIGFYVETFLGILVLPDVIKLTPNLWMILAGFGFLIQALVNIYTYFMAKNQGVANSRLKFLYNRFIAEFIRIAIHFQPFGIPVSCSFVKDDIIISKSRRILRSLVPTDNTFSKVESDKIIAHSLRMINDQIAYHTNTKNRLALIVKKLQFFFRIMFWIGFSFVIFRGILQFAMPYISTYLQGEISNGIKWISYIRSLANMLALLLPALALYFSTKLTLNNFDGLYKHSDTAIKNLVDLKNKAESLKNNDDISYEVLVAFSEDILSIQVGEVNAWYTQTFTKTITRL